MEKVDITINEANKRSYPVLIDENLLENAYDYIKKYTAANKFLIVTNTTVNALYGNKLKHENSEFVILPDGEEYKNSEILNKILDKAFEIKLERKDAIIALGGGVIGDMAGFAAAIYLRGIDYIQIPTTLLAQVDSSLGGKTAVNRKEGKNVLGCFYQPKLVLSDINTLNTLDERQFKTGLSEILKYAFIEKTCGADRDYNLFMILQNDREKIYKKNPDILKEVIKICCTLKSSVINRDEKETGLRAVLNFGHTYAHAIETFTDYKLYTHGEAVSIGMQLIFNLAEELAFVTKEYYNRAVELIKNYELKTKLDIAPDKDIFYNIMLSDKKVKNKSVNFIMPAGEREAKIINNIDKNLILRNI